MEEENIKNNIFVLMIKGIVISMLLTLVAIFVLSILLTFTNVSENVITSAVIFLSSFSILIGGFLIAKKVDNKGIVYGSILGVIYMALLYVISSILNSDFSLNFSSIIMIVVGIVGGAIGGVLGINLK